MSAAVLATSGTLGAPPGVAQIGSPPTTLAMPLTSIITLRVDPTWAYYADWVDNAPASIGASFSPTFLDFDSGFEISSSPNYQDVAPVGRAESFKTYVGNSNRELSILFQFRAQGLGATANQNQQLYNAIQNEVLLPCRWLESLKYPFIDAQGISHAPPPLILVLGQILTMRCLLMAGNPKYMAPFDPVTGLPMSAEFAVQLVSISPSMGNYNFANSGYTFGGQAPPTFTPPSAPATAATTPSLPPII
jgi:acyl-CoA synthetase (AMP-forming)/AMP-acid ligase II